MQINELIRFVYTANLGTYASQGDSATVAPLLPESRQLEFREGDFFYRDIFFGMAQFVGQAVVYHSGHAVWSMCYSGGMCTQVDLPAAGSIYAFLREALRAMSPGMPVRGPVIFEGNGMRYTCQYNGNFTLFHGAEEITRDSELLYQLHFLGGNIL